MARFLKNRSKLVGKAPGTVVFIGKKKMEQIRFRLIRYNENNIDEFESDELKPLLSKIDGNMVNWLNIDGLHDLKLIEQLGAHFGLSPLQTENIANTDQRPKASEHDNKWVLHLKTLRFHADSRKISSDQVTLILGEQLLISFQENVGNTFDPIRERLRMSGGKLRTSGPDYLAYRIMDALADQYMLCLSELGDLIEQNEVKILSNGKPTLIEELYRYKIELSYIRKAVLPVREMIKQMKNSDTDAIKSDTQAYFNALDDLIAHSVETIDIYYNMIGDQINVYNTNMLNRTNDVMKVLTIFSTIFIPLTFITGVYGTNFEFLPELHFRYGYFAMWLFIVLIAMLMLYYFRKKKWM